MTNVWARVSVSRLLYLFLFTLYGFICAGTEVACACSAMSPAIIDTPGIKPLLLMRSGAAARWTWKVQATSLTSD